MRRTRAARADGSPAAWALMFIAAIALASASNGAGVPRQLRIRTKNEVDARSIDTSPRRAAPAGEHSGDRATIAAAPNCQLPDPYDARTSDRQFYIVADDFAPAAAGSISSIRWWGAFARISVSGFVDCQGENPDDFTVRYYRNVAGLPGPLLSSFSQSLGSLTVSAPIATGAIVAGIVPEYEINATHPAIPVNAGECLWIEISNGLPAPCTWFWEISAQGNGWAMQDGDGANPPNGYNIADATGTDFAWCINSALGNVQACGPSGPSNDNCANAATITGEGNFPFDNTDATTTPGRIDECYPSTDIQVEGDVWFCWTAPCSETVLASTCGLTSRDTAVAVYDTCVCPAASSNLITCNDDRCGIGSSSPIQSMSVFQAVAGHTYLIRVGTYPETDRGTGSLGLACGPPDDPACNTASGDCCADLGTPGCGDELCCELVCACDSFCCDTQWDEACAGYGFRDSGCGAALLCAPDCAVCGNPNAGGCCQANPGQMGCNDADCCDAVCACDSFCCQVEWDEFCAREGASGTGCGAALVCPGLCGGQDADGDGVPDSNDNCPNVVNPGQNDCNSDGQGDSCDPDAGQRDEDIDGRCDESDRCPGFNDTVDTDGDGAPNGCDICPGSDDGMDADADGTPDGCDACPVDNPDDSDGDQVCDSVDRCPGQDDRVDMNQNGLPDCSEPAAIPAASAWNTFVLALLLITVHKMESRRRHSPRSA